MSTRKGPPHAQVLDLVSGKLISKAISLAADLALADQLIGGARSVRELAEKLEVNEDALYRLMRTLESIGIFEETGEGEFENSELSEVLRSDHPQSVRAYARWYGTDLHWDVWKNLDYSLRTGRPSLTREHPDSGPFEVLAQHPQAHQIFIEAMTGFTLSEAMNIVQSYDFSGYGSMMDVGGAHGALALAIHKEYPDLELSVFDLPHVLEGAAELKKSSLKAVAGSFFDPIPGAVDACILKHIIHDWGDQD